MMMHYDEETRHCAVEKMMAIAIMNSDCILCWRNKAWDEPEVRTLEKFPLFFCRFLSAYFSFVFVQVGDCKLPIKRGLQLFVSKHSKKLSLKTDVVIIKCSFRMQSSLQIHFFTCLNLLHFGVWESRCGMSYRGKPRNLTSRYLFGEI